MQIASYTVRCIFRLCALSLAGAVCAQDLTEVLCDPQDPELGCPGEYCTCVHDTLAVTFDGDSSSVFEYDEFVEGTRISVTMVMEVKSEELLGWSYGVRHDPTALSILDVTIEGTDAAPALGSKGFNDTRFEGVQTCGSDPECRDENRTDGGGWISIIMLRFTPQLALPLGRRVVARAEYSLSKDVGNVGTRIELSDRLAAAGNPRAEFAVSIDEHPHLWEKVTHGLVKKRAEEKVRALCDPADPARSCDYPGCLCAPDTLEVTFDGEHNSVLEYSEFADGMEFEATVVTETETTGVQGWQYGVAHDPAALEILDVTIAGTVAESAFQGGFDNTTTSVQTCGADPECDFDHRTEGGGWISAIILNFNTPVTLPVVRNELARARYRILKDVGPEGTLIRFSDRMAVENSPKIALDFIVGTSARQWMTVVDGWVKGQGCSGDQPFRRGDVGMWKSGEEYRADGILNIIDPVRLLRAMFKEEGISFYCDKAADANDDGTLDIADPICILQHLFLGGPQPAAPFGEPGLDETPDGLACCAYP